MVLRLRNYLCLCFSVALLGGCSVDPGTGIDRDPAQSGRAATTGTGFGTARVESQADQTSNDPVSTLTVNGEVITTADVLRPIRAPLEQRLATMGEVDYNRYLVEMVQQSVRAKARDALLYHEASKNLTDQERQGIGDYVDQRIRERVNTEYAGRQTRYERALAVDDLTIEDEREDMIREFIIGRWLRATVTPKAADPTREQLWQLFETHKGKYTKPARRRMQMIEVSIMAQLPPGVSAPTQAQLDGARAAARDKAERSRQMIVEGRDFGEVAREYSDGLHARNGGHWGWVTRGSVRAKWAPAVEALYCLEQPGAPSAVIETDDDFFVVEAAEIDPGQTPDFEELQPELVERFRNAQFNMLVDQWVARLQAEARIEPENINRFLIGVMNDAPSLSTSSP